MEHDLVFVNLKTGEKKQFMFTELMSSELHKSLNSSIYPEGVSKTFVISFLGWDNNGDGFWCKAGVVGGGDPPVEFDVFLFKINLVDLSVDIHPGFPNIVMEILPNFSKSKFLFESVDDTHSLHTNLYLYDVINRGLKLVDSFDINHLYSDWFDFYMVVVFITNITLKVL